MKRTLAFVLSVLIMLTSVAPALAAEAGTVYYIDSVSGNDANSGTSQENAWRSLERAAQNTYNPGDSILLKCGQNYSGSFITKGSGTQNAPVTVSSYGSGSRPVLTGSGDSYMLIIHNVSNWTIENLELTAPNGKGIAIFAGSGTDTEYINIRSCLIHDITPNERKTSSAAINIDNDRNRSRLRHIHLDSLTIYNVSWAIHTNGWDSEGSGYGSNTPDELYNSDYLFENIYVENATYGGIVIGSVQDCTVRNCRLIKCATAAVLAYAPVWTRHANRVTIEYCEISGSTNPQDGMAIDFDGWTTNSTYRYIYSHDNNRFMRNCVYDNNSQNSGNSVYNCVSVNDKTGINHAASSLVSKRDPAYAKMSNFSFHDNIIVNGKPIVWSGVKNSSVYNNSFSGGFFYNFIQKLLNLFTGVGGFSYSVDSALLNERISEITKDLPNR